MDLKHLQYVVDMTEYTPISSAAEHMYISQSYLSRIVKRVENDFNIVLFVRTPQGINLTAEGEKFINRAKLILSQYVLLIINSYTVFPKIITFRLE